MKKQVKLSILLGLGIFILACDLALNSAVSPTELPVAKAPTVTPAPTYTPYPTYTPNPTYTPFPTPKLIPTQEVVQIPVMPEAIENTLTDDFGEALSQLLDQKVISFAVPVSLEVVQTFYQEALTAQGWTWVRTNFGESLVVDNPVSILAQDFERSEASLSIFAFGKEGQSNTLVLAGTNVSSDELMITYLTVTGYLHDDRKEPSAEDIKPNAMRFSSPLLEFDYPSSWFPTQHPQPFSFRTDIEEGAINIFDDPRRCTNDDQDCFTNFTLLTGSLFDAPVMIRLQPSQNEMTLENWDAQKWTILTEVAQSPSAPSRDIYRYEDLIATDSLELIEIKPLTLKDGTPALQRLYRWRQVGLSTPLMSSYTLFKRDDIIIEFYTDFTQEEWGILGPTVQETILSIELSP